MKNFVMLVIAMLAFQVISAQTQMNTTITLQPNVSYYKYTGDASDTIKRVADSVYIELVNQFDTEYKLNIGSKFDLVSAADTAVFVSVWGKNFADESYTLISSAASSNISASNTTISTAYTTATRYRYIKVSYRLKGAPKSAGVKVEKIEVKLWKL